MRCERWLEKMSLQRWVYNLDFIELCELCSFLLWIYVIYRMPFFESMHQYCSDIWGVYLSKNDYILYRLVGTSICFFVSSIRKKFERPVIITFILNLYQTQASFLSLHSVWNSIYHKFYLLKISQKSDANTDLFYSNLINIHLHWIGAIEFSTST